MTSNLTAAFTSADSVVTSNLTAAFTAADHALRAAYEEADVGLQNQISNKRFS